MRILITNDDGITAPGLEVLARHVARWIDEAPAHEVREAIVVAPSVNHSDMPEWLTLGATTMASRTSCAGASSIQRATWRANTSSPGAVIPSSLVMRILIRRTITGVRYT